jgi:alginate O-acetyltransferase complex protein AlgI
MSFASHIFIFYFLPIILLCYHLIPRKSHLLRKAFLLIASYAFYAWLNPLFVILLVFTTIFNYILSIIIADSKSNSMRLPLMVICVVENLGLLGFFKYAGFYQDNLNSMLKLFGAGTFSSLKIVLPVGISFFTFKILSYIIDVYRGNFPAHSFLDFACYVAFFPQLLSGPIQRYGTIDAKSERVPIFAEQLEARTEFLSRFSYGVALFILGFSKKVLLANVIGKVVDAVFAAEAPGSMDVWFGVFAYTFQLYFDFSAYSEMAIGLGSMLGFDCPRNFNAPYLADSITDFWRRWHISLSSWFRDYLYIPLGGNRKGVTRSYLNLIVVFLLCGLWHGANWTFIIWGIYHGTFLVLERLLGRKTIYSSLPRPIQICVTFLFVTIGWVFFRSPTITDAWRLLTVMFTFSPPQGGSILLIAVLYTPTILVTMAICVILTFQPVQAFDWVKTTSWLKIVILIVLFCLSLVTMFTQTYNPFLYFQF